MLIKFSYCFHVPDQKLNKRFWPTSVSIMTDSSPKTPGWNSYFSCFWESFRIYTTLLHIKFYSCQTETLPLLKLESKCWQQCGRLNDIYVFSFVIWIYTYNVFNWGTQCCVEYVQRQLYLSVWRLMFRKRCFWIIVNLIKFPIC